MWKLIFFGLIIWLAVHIFKRMMRQSGAPDATANSDEAPNNHQELAQNTEDMVQCASCAVHFPRSEGYLVKGNFYCCQAHIK